MIRPAANDVGNANGTTAARAVAEPIGDDYV
jgi:hypothetical protein